MVLIFYRDETVNFDSINYVNPFENISRTIWYAFFY